MLLKTHLNATCISLIFLRIFTVTPSWWALVVNVNSAECWAVLNTGCRTVALGVSAGMQSRILSFKTV